MLNVASLYELEAMVLKGGGDPDTLRQEGADGRIRGAVLDKWISTTARNLAIAAAASASVVEIEAVLIDGAMPRWVSTSLIREVAAELDRMNITGVEKPEVVQGKVGSTARSIGAAMLPIHAQYFPS